MSRSALSDSWLRWGANFTGRRIYSPLQASFIGCEWNSAIYHRVFTRVDRQSPNGCGGIRSGRLSCPFHGSSEPLDMPWVGEAGAVERYTVDMKGWWLWGDPNLQTQIRLQRCPTGDDWFVPGARGASGVMRGDPDSRYRLPARVALGPSLLKPPWSAGRGWARSASLCCIMISFGAICPILAIPLAVPKGPY